MAPLGKALDVCAPSGRREHHWGASRCWLRWKRRCVHVYRSRKRMVDGLGEDHRRYHRTGCPVDAESEPCDDNACANRSAHERVTSAGDPHFSRRVPEVSLRRDPSACQHECERRVRCGCKHEIVHVRAEALEGTNYADGSCSNDGDPHGLSDAQEHDVARHPVKTRRKRAPDEPGAMRRRAC